MEDENNQNSTNRGVLNSPNFMIENIASNRMNQKESPYKNELISGKSPELDQESEPEEQSSLKKRGKKKITTKTDQIDSNLEGERKKENKKKVKNNETHFSNDNGLDYLELLEEIQRDKHKDKDKKKDQNIPSYDWSLPSRKITIPFLVLTLIICIFCIIVSFFRPVCIIAIFYSTFISFITSLMLSQIIFNNPERLTQILPIELKMNETAKIFMSFIYFGLILVIILQLLFGIICKTSTTSFEYCENSYYCHHKTCTELNKEYLNQAIPPSDYFAIIKIINNDIYMTSQTSPFFGWIDDCYVNTKTLDVTCVSRLKMYDGGINELRVKLMCNMIDND